MGSRMYETVFLTVLTLSFIAVGSVPLPTTSPTVSLSSAVFSDRIQVTATAEPAHRDPVPEPAPRPLLRPAVTRPPIFLGEQSDTESKTGSKTQLAYRAKESRFTHSSAIRDASLKYPPKISAVDRAGASNLPQMGQTYSGWGTYYGIPPMPPNSHVHCHLPNMGEGLFGWHGVHRTVAMNAVQYVGSMACGTCVEIWGHGRLCPGGVEGPDCGMGPQMYAINETRILAVVTDELWEKGYGDIDFGVHGDGIYPAKWRPYPCPWAKSMARITLHSGANRNYIKIQFRYLDSGMRFVTNEGSGETSVDRFHDNHFVFQAGGLAGIQGWQNGKLKFRAVSNLGTHYCGEIDRKLQAAPFEYGAWAC